LKPEEWLSEVKMDPHAKEAVMELLEQVLAEKREAQKKAQKFRGLLERWLHLRPNAQKGRQVLYEETELALRETI
jgi:predicted Fe-S protein YdhL (DUF1289 family)